DQTFDLVTVRDVSAWKDMEAALRESRHRFDAFMNNAPVIAFAKDADGRMIYVNKEYTSRFGLDAESYLGKFDHELWPTDIAAQLRATDLRVLAGPTSVELREKVPTPDGVLREWWIAKFPFRDSQGRVFLGGIGIDLTERMQLEDDLRRTEQRYQQL